MQTILSQAKETIEQGIQRIQTQPEKDAVVVEIAESNETGETKKKHKRGEELNIFFPSSLNSL